MKPAFRRGTAVVAAAIAGWAASEIVYRSPTCRAEIARLFGGGNLVCEERLRARAAVEHASAAEIEHGMSLLRAQFPSDAAFARALAASGLTSDALAMDVTEQLKAGEWIEWQIAAARAVTEAQCRAFYAAHPQVFAQPARWRASHIFLAAPDGSPPEVLEAKRRAMEALAARLAQGESFTQVAATSSEDAATKTRGGDLNFFSAARMPAEFVAEVAKLRVGEISAPFHSHLGFHILQLTDARPAAALSFEASRSEISTKLANDARSSAIAALRETLTGRKPSLVAP